MTVNPPAIARPNPDKVRFSNGDLYWNPTDLNDPVAGYGTYLGHVAESGYLMPNVTDIDIPFEEGGAEILDQLHIGLDVHFIAMLKEHTTKNYELGFAPHNLSNKDAFAYTSKVGVGARRSTISGGKLLFVPYDRTNHNAFLMCNALPKLDASARLMKALIDYPEVLPVVFRGIAGNTERIITVDKLANISLADCTGGGEA